MLKSEKGASSVEYAILLASVALAICSGVYFFGQTVAGHYLYAQKTFEAMAPAAPAPAAPTTPDTGGTGDGGGASPASPGGGSGPASGSYGGASQ